MKRRTFVKSTAIISSAAILKPGIVFGSKANSAIRMGIIGCGNRGTAVISAMSKNTNISIVAMADIFDFQLQAALGKYNKLNTDK
jgi:predicted homoserine dehydrogenase-like protein